MHVRECPPLRVSMDIETPGGKHYRWGEDEPSPENVPSGLRWSDTMPGGFETLDCVLPRKSGIDYADLEQLSTIRVLGASGDVAGEFRLERAPRTSGDQVSVSPGAVGWQAHLEDDKSAREIYVDRDLSRWGGMSRSRRVSFLGGSYEPFDSTVNPDESSGIPAILTQIDGAWAAGHAPAVEAWYDAGAGRKIAIIYYESERNTATMLAGDANWSYSVSVWDNDDSTGPTDAEVDQHPSSTGHYFTPGNPRRYGMLQLRYDAAPAGVDGAQYPLWWKWVAVYADHGLPVIGGSPQDPGGLFGSDVIVDAVSRWAPLLTITTESVQGSSFVIPHLIFPEPTTAGEIVRQTTRFGLQDWGVWDNKTFWWHERGTFSKRWRSRVAPAQLDETGPQVDRLWESIIVSYQDVDGTTKTVGPPGSGANTEDAVLKDDDPDNPANQLGIVRRDVLQMGTSTVAGATEVGRRFLEQAKVLDRSGRARLVGNVEDDRGVLHPYWRPRAGDYIEFLDAADPSPRRIVKTDKDHPTRTCGLDLDAPPEGLQALLERLGVVLVPLSL